jgi:prepilin signal peptidase PulO-like enzyme (type II secretory pathway)
LDPITLMLPAVTVVGMLIGWASWVVARSLGDVAGADSRPAPRLSEALPLVCAAIGGGVLGLAAVRAGDDLAVIARVAILAVPLLITLATDVLDRLVFPAVLLPGLLIALGFAATAPIGLRAAVIASAGAAVAAALLVTLSRLVWSRSGEIPLGSGEILIAATAGAMLGPERTSAALFAGMVLAAITAGLVLVTRRARREEALPYGAFLCLATLGALAT